MPSSSLPAGTRTAASSDSPSTTAGEEETGGGLCASAVGGGAGAAGGEVEPHPATAIRNPRQTHRFAIIPPQNLTCRHRFRLTRYDSERPRRTRKRREQIL